MAGTRADAIKLAPVVARLSADSDLRTTFLVTGQHRELLYQALATFGLTPDFDLEIMERDLDVGVVLVRALEGVRRAIRDVEPQLVVVQGDTTTSFAAALAAFYERAPVAHVEAGLRTNDLAQPFPEEANRALISVIARLHLAPTPTARANLVAEGVPVEQILVTGNTAIDALREVASRELELGTRLLEGILQQADSRRLVVITSHRRESWGEVERGIARAIARVATASPAYSFVLPLHPNPRVRTAMRPFLRDLPNVHVTGPLAYPEMIGLLSRAYAVATDSGGIQEEACALGVPTLVLRDVTERPEGVDRGVTRVIGTREDRVEHELGRLLGDESLRRRMAKASGVFGDGRASERIHGAVRTFVGFPTGVEEFVPPADEGAG